MIEDIIRQVIQYFKSRLVQQRFIEGQHLALSTLSLGSINFALVTPSQWSSRGTSEAMTISYNIPIGEIKINTKDKSVCVQAKRSKGRLRCRSTQY